MSNRKKLGVFVPDRPSNHLQLNADTSAIGCFHPDILSSFRSNLRASTQVEVIENLNFRNAIILDGNVYVDDFCLNELDRFFWYCEIDRSPGSFDLEVLKTLSRKTEVIRNPYSFEKALDKYNAHLCLKDAGVNVPEFVLFDHKVPARMEAILNDWGAGVLKPRRGGWGKGVTLIDSPEKLRDIIGYIRSTAESSPDHGFFMERYYDNDPKRWASITVVNGEIAFGYRKLESKFHDFGNGKLKVQDLDEKGGEVVLAELNAEHIEQSHRAYEALELEWIGFDMIWTKQGPIIIDENTSPGNYVELYQQVQKDPGKLFAQIALNGI